jgi:glycosyltransferase involved in cell wall biosynthesis
MRLTVVWHKPVWPAAGSPSGYAARGCLGNPGFAGLPDQVRALSELFDETRIVGPCSTGHEREGEVPLSGRRVDVVPLRPLPRSGFASWAALPFWIVSDGGRLAREIRRADAVFAYVPSPIGLLGLALALVTRKPVLVRHLNPWRDPRWIWRLERALLERIAGGRNVVFATGASARPPSERNRAVAWLFVTSLSEDELDRREADPARRAARGDSRAIGEGSAPGAGVHGGRPVRLVTVTRDLETRGTGLLLEAVGLLAAELPAVALDVVGSGPSAAACRRMAEDLGVSERVTFHGSVSRERLRSVLGEAALLCLAANETEGSRQGLHEALAAGLPVVATRTAAPPGLLEGCGVVVPHGSARPFADAVRACLVDDGRYRRLSAAAIRMARSHSLERWVATVRCALEAGWPLGAAPAPPPRARTRGRPSEAAS